MRVVFAIFLAAHGFVHLLYIGQALHKFEIKPGLQWPDGAWALSWLPTSALQWVATVLLGLIGLSFFLAGGALALKAGWWQPVAIGAAGVSIVSLLLLWNGRMESLDAQGLVAIALNIAIIAVGLLVSWPDVAA